MLLSGEEIKKRSLIRDGAESNFRGSSYDIRIGTILSSQDGEEVKEFSLPAQGMVEVISQELVSLPADVSGYALVKTSLCNEGVLALSIGIIDPYYEGPLSSVLINFGKSNVKLKEGDTFLRLTFHQYQAPEGLQRREPVSKSFYVKDKRRQVSVYLSETFLDIRKTSEAVTEKVLGEWRKSLFIWVPLCAACLAFFALLVNAGSSWATRFAAPKDQIKAELLVELQKEQIKVLESRLALLEAQVGGIRSQQQSMAQVPQQQMVPQSQNSAAGSTPKRVNQ